MQLTLGLEMCNGQSTPVLGSTATLAPQISEVLSDGWRASHPDISGFEAAPENSVFSVRRSGYDTSGTAVLVDDAVQIAARVRLPYPDQTTLTADSVALSDFVYAPDVITGVTNQSVRPYPKPVAVWLNHDRERATGSSHVLRLAVCHGQARHGQPVAAVKFVVSDGTKEVSHTVAHQSVAYYDASGLSIPHFQAEMDLSLLAQGALLTVDAVIYPWVGEAFTISTDADPYPSPNLTVLKLLNDRTGAYGTAYAFVDADSGNDATGTVSSNKGAASLSPFATIPQAATAIRTYNAGHFARTNDAGGGVIRLTEGVHVLGAIKTQGAAALVPMLIEAADPLKIATTVLTDSASNLFNGIPALLKLRNITLRKTGASITFLDSGAGSADSLLVAENCLWDANGTNYYGAWVYRVGVFKQINCAIAGGRDPRQGNSFSTEAIMVSAVGCQSCAGTITYNAIGCSDLAEFTVRDAVGARPAMQGVFLGWNVFSNGETPNAIVNSSAPVGERGFAFVGNIVESWGTATNAAIMLNADNDANPTQNIVIQHNTIAGERANLLYVDGAVDADKSAYVKNNIFHSFNIKGDVFSNQSTGSGNWPVRYKVGWSSNASAEGASNANNYSPSSWLGERPSTGETTGFPPPWHDDKSHSGTNTGGGDYRIATAGSIPVVAEGQTAYPSDLFGNAIVPGQSLIGAVAAPV